MSIARRAAHGAIRAYQLTLSGIAGRQCRHAPSCSEYTDEAIQRHGLWAGGFIGLARICRCHPWGTEGFDPVPQALPPGARWARPWAYGVWRGPLGAAQDSQSGRNPACAPDIKQPVGKYPGASRNTP